MSVAPYAVLVLIALVGISGLYFYRGRQLTLGRRMAASAHGILALMNLPVAGVIVARRLDPESAATAIAFYAFPALAIASMIYSFRALRDSRYFHLLHILTFNGLSFTTFFAGLAVFGAG